MMTDPKYLQADSIFASLNKAGTRVTVITAKDKLLRLLQAGLDAKTSTSLSVEFAESAGAKATFNSRGIASATSLMNNIPPPGIYDPDISIYALAMGHRLLQMDHTNATSIVPSMYYLSTTDYVQHKWAPGESQANDFYAKVDTVIGQLDAAGAVVGLTADHGMNSKIRYDGSPKVVYIETLLKEAGYTDYRVILPITDPYVKHHGALGSYATIHLSAADKPKIQQVMAMLRATPGLYSVLNREEACKAFDLPPSRVADIVCLGNDATVLGRSPEHHQLGEVPNLRSHGGIDEATVPMFINRPLTRDYSRRLTSGKLRNWHLFDVLCNGIA